MKKYYKCTLESDIVINASLATEGNMKTLDYIPGSNFLGIVAKHYKLLNKEKKAYDIFHSGIVSFGDAHISKGSIPSYPMPFSLFTDKLNPEVRGADAKVWVHHALDEKEKRPKDKDGYFLQLKQHRTGYLNKHNDFIAGAKKRFALKSAQSRALRKAEKSAMFGFESMKAGQEFIFYIEFKNELYEPDITGYLTGLQRIGKSKSAEYGQVKIEILDDPTGVFDHLPCGGQRLLIYAESNLCFINNYGQTTFQPAPKDFGLEGLGTFNWAASQIRTYPYSPWNGKRQTTDGQRNCIKKGSVLVFDFTETKDVKLPSSNSVGGFQAEGLGRVIYNPAFIKASDKALWDFELNKEERPMAVDLVLPEQDENKYIGSLSKILLKKYVKAEKDFAIGTATLLFLTKEKHNNKSYTSYFSNIPASQWGGIRAKATKSLGVPDLIETLFDLKKGILTNGVAADRYWNKRGGVGMELLKKSIKSNEDLGTTYVIKLATEMAKWKQRYDQLQKKQSTTT